MKNSRFGKVAHSGEDINHQYFLWEKCRFLVLFSSFFLLGLSTSLPVPGAGINSGLGEMVWERPQFFLCAPSCVYLCKCAPQYVQGREIISVI